MAAGLDCNQEGNALFHSPMHTCRREVLFLIGFVVHCCQVWASKWNERAYFSTRKAKMDHSDLSMAVLVQEVVQADYAFVIHTTNPSTEDPTEIYAEVVKGLGETLVGAYSGRALSFIAKKSDINSPKVETGGE